VNQYGQIAFDEWMKLPERYPNLELDVFQIMPNHIHAIILLTNPAAVGANPCGCPYIGNTVSPNGNMVAPIGDDITPIANDIIRAGVNPAPTGVSDIVGAY
jgi:putative transposase